MKNTTVLSMFQDNANDEYGFAHKNSLEKGFNAFYNGTGIFHDVFEHWFEGMHKHFSGENSFNIGGEIAAMGAFAYYCNQLGVHNRYTNRYNSVTNSAIYTTLDMLIESYDSDGYNEFGGNGLMSIPAQKMPDSWVIDELCSEYCEKLKELKSKGVRKSEYTDQSDYLRAKDFVKTIKAAKVRNLSIWGYKMAEKMVPDSYENANVCAEFIEFWNKFCKTNSAKELANYVKELHVTTQTKNGELKISAKFKLSNGEFMKIDKYTDMDGIMSALYEEEY